MEEAKLSVVSGVKPSFTMVGRSRPYGFSTLVIVSMLVFAIGYLFPIINPSAIGGLIDGPLTKMFAMAQSIHSSGLDFGNSLLFLFILVKNLAVAAIILWVGDSMFGLPLIYVLLANGVSVGFVVYLLHAAAASSLVIMAALLPHGVIELPALFLAAAAAYSMGRNHVPPAGRLKAGLRTVAPLFVLAAVVEVYVTPDVVTSVLRLVR